MTDPLTRYQEMLVELLLRRADPGALAPELEASLADERAKLWETLSPQQRIELEDWIDAQLRSRTRKSGPW